MLLSSILVYTLSALTAAAAPRPKPAAGSAADHRQVTRKAIVERQRAIARGHYRRADPSVLSYGKCPESPAEFDGAVPYAVFTGSGVSATGQVFSYDTEGTYEDCIESCNSVEECAGVLKPSNVCFGFATLMEITERFPGGTDRAAVKGYTCADAISTFTSPGTGSYECCQYYEEQYVSPCRRDLGERC